MRRGQTRVEVDFWCSVCHAIRMSRQCSMRFVVEVANDRTKKMVAKIFWWMYARTHTLYNEAPSYMVVSPYEWASDRGEGAKRS